LDILIHEQALKTINDEDDGQNGRHGSKPRSKYAKFKVTKTNETEPDVEVATIIDFNKGTQSAKTQFNADALDKHLPITYLDPVTGQKKCEYRCYNVFTRKLANMVETEQHYGFLFCPSPDCGIKVGIYSLNGQKCQTCLTMVTPAFQWFRSRLI